jgi:hypothetical protein
VSRLRPAKNTHKTRQIASRPGHFFANCSPTDKANLSKHIEEASSYYYFPHITKQEYDCAFEQARQWALSNPKEPLVAAARIYHVKEEALRKSVF